MSSKPKSFAPEGVQVAVIHSLEKAAEKQSELVRKLENLCHQLERLKASGKVLAESGKVHALEFRTKLDSAIGEE